MTLIQLAQRNEQANPQTVHNVKELVQQLIDNSITAEAFTERLQTELQSSPQVLSTHYSRFDQSTAPCCVLERVVFKFYKIFFCSRIWFHFFESHFHYYVVRCTSRIKQQIRIHQPAL